MHYQHWDAASLEYISLKRGGIVWDSGCLDEGWAYGVLGASVTLQRGWCPPAYTSPREGPVGYLAPNHHGARFGKVPRFSLGVFSQVQVLDLTTIAPDLKG